MGHRFEHNHGVGVFSGRVYQQISRTVCRCHVGQRTQEMHPVCDLQLLGFILESGDPLVIPDHRQVHLGHLGQGVQQSVQSLFSVIVADEQGQRFALRQGQLSARTGSIHCRQRRMNARRDHMHMRRSFRISLQCFGHHLIGCGDDVFVGLETKSCSFKKPVGEQAWAGEQGQPFDATLEWIAGVEQAHPKRSDVNGLQIAMPCVFVRVHDIESLPRLAPGLPCKPELIDPTWFGQRARNPVVSHPWKSMLDLLGEDMHIMTSSKLFRHCGRIALGPPNR